MTASTAKQKSDALHVLRGAVAILPHDYDRDPYSGAGNCWCGRHEESPLHAATCLIDPGIPYF